MNIKYWHTVGGRGKKIKFKGGEGRKYGFDRIIDS
jgi:hypothetical protein